MKQPIVLLVDRHTVRRLDKIARRYGRNRQWIVGLACDVVAELVEDPVECVSVPCKPGTGYQYHAVKSDSCQTP